MENVSPFLTTRDAKGGMRFRPFAIPLIIAAICVPIVAAMSAAGTFGAGLGMAVGALAVTSLLLFAVRAKPNRTLEVAETSETGRAVRVVAATEATAEAAERIAELAGSASDVRL